MEFSEASSVVSKRWIGKEALLIASAHSEHVRDGQIRVVEGRHSLVLGGGSGAVCRSRTHFPTRSPLFCRLPLHPRRPNDQQAQGTPSFWPPPRCTAAHRPPPLTPHEFKLRACITQDRDPVSCHCRAHVAEALQKLLRIGKVRKPEAGHPTPSALMLAGTVDRGPWTMANLPFHLLHRLSNA